MMSENYTKTAKTGYIALSVILSIFGIILISVPDFSMTLAVRICGGIMTAFGGFKLIGYFSKDLFRLAFQYDLAFGILLMSIGALMLIRPKGIINIAGVMIGLYILADGLMKIQISIDSKRFGIRSWYLIMIMAVLACTAGLVLLFKPSDGARIIVILIGISLLLEGALNMLTVLVAVKLKNKNIIDVKISDND